VVWGRECDVGGVSLGDGVIGVCSCGGGAGGLVAWFVGVVW